MSWPTSVATNTDLYLAVNNLSTVLTDNPLTAGATTINVSDASSFPADGILTIDLEAIHYTGKTATSFTGCTRGFDGTTGASHALNATVFHDIPAAHHNVLKDELIAIETSLAATLGLSPAAYTASRALQSNGSGVIEVSSVTNTELGYVSGVTSAIQTQLGTKLNLSGGNMSGALGFDNASPDGTLHVGALAAPANHNGTVLFGEAKSTGANSGHGLSDVSTWTGNAGTAYASIDSRFGSIGTNNYDHLAGFQAAFTHGSTGTLTHSYGSVMAFANNGGLVTNRYGLYVSNAGGTGSITTQYGVYIPSLTKGSTNYAIYTAASTPSQFNGDIQSNAQIITKLGSKTNTAVAPTGNIGTGLFFTNADTWNLAANDVDCLSGVSTLLVAKLDFVPNGDNNFTNGNVSNRWSDTRSVLINGADYGFMNGWFIREYPATFKDVQEKDEAWFKANANQGLQFVNDIGELVAVIGRDGTIYANSFKPLTDLDSTVRSKNISSPEVQEFERQRREELRTDKPLP